MCVRDREKERERIPERNEQEDERNRQEWAEREAIGDKIVLVPSFMKPQAGNDEWKKAELEQDTGNNFVFFTVRRFRAVA